MEFSDMEMPVAPTDDQALIAYVAMDIELSEDFRSVCAFKKKMSTSNDTTAESATVLLVSHRQVGMEGVHPPVKNLLW